MDSASPHRSDRVPRASKVTRGLTFLVPLAALTGFILAAAWALNNEPRGPIFDGPMVQLLQPDGFTLTWRSELPGSQEVVARVKGATESRTFPAEPGQRHQAVITGCLPGTVYQYDLQIPADGHTPAAVLASGWTRTAPEFDQPFRFLAFGDSGSGYQVQFDLAKLMIEQDPDLVIHTGDIIYPDGALKRYHDKFFLPYAELIKRAAFYPCLGNHDWDDYFGEPMYATFELPCNGPEDMHAEEAYWFDFGGVRFVTLNSNAGFSRTQKSVGNWLEGALSTAAERWKVVYFHHPLYTNGDHTAKGSFRQLVQPILERWQTDLVLVGHNHMYERSKPLRAGNVVAEAEGTVHITTGGGGGSLQEFRHPKPDFLAVQDDRQHCFTVVDVTSEQLHVRQIGVDRQVMDDFEILRRPRTLTQSTGP